MQDLIEQLKRHEGVKTHAYKDHLGYITVGVGAVPLKMGLVLVCQKTRLITCCSTI